MDPEAQTLLQIGRNCGRLEQAEHVSVLIDGENYFAAVYEAMSKARHSIYILGWEIHSGVNLRPKVDDGQSYRMVDVLERLTAARPELHVYILAWDFSSIYSLEREMLQWVKLGWLSNAQIRFAFDANHPLGGSHHQKLVVVDDQVAFCGGLDLTLNRWDEVQHAPNNPARVLPNGRPYMAFHDVQVVVDGDAARAIGELARERWSRATGEALLGPQATDPTASGRGLLGGELMTKHELVLERCWVGISRTLPDFKLQTGLREIEAYYRDAIAAANDYIYIENQYFTSQPMARCLVEILEKSSGPEVVIVLPKKAGGWLEEQTMGALQNLVLELLAKADIHGRLKVYYPDDARMKGQDYIKVHSKVMICDGTQLHIGSANLNNRSMGLDSECDLSVDATANKRQQAMIAKVVAALIADHTGSQVSEAAEAIANSANLAEAIAALNHKHPHKRLANKKPTPPEGLLLSDSIVELQIGDWERPAKFEHRLDHWGLLHEDFRRYNPLFDSRVVFVATVAFAGILALLWAFTPFAQYLNWSSLRHYLGTSGSVVGVTSFMIVLYMLGGLLFVPLNLLIIVTASIFPLYTALALIVLGAVANAATGYTVGRVLHRYFKDAKFFGKRSRKIMTRLRSGSLWSIVLIRILPVAPNSLINITAGFCSLPLVKFLLGTTLGILPGAVALTFFQRSLLQLLREASWENALLAILILGAMLVVYLAINRRFSRYNEDS